VARKKTRKQNTILDERAFDAVPKLLEECKYFEYSLEEALKSITAKQRVEWRTVHSIRDTKTGEQIDVPLRLRIGGTPNDAEGWQVSLIVGNRRVDGFDFEARFCDMDGVERNGWHRHIWNPQTRAAPGKSAVTLFNRPAITFHEFLVQALKHMNVFYRKDDDSDVFLF